MKRNRMERSEMSSSQVYRSFNAQRMSDGSMQARVGIGSADGGDRSMQIRFGIGSVDGGEELVRNTLAKLPHVSDLYLVESKGEVKRQDVLDFNDRFSDDILLHIFQFNWRPAQSWHAAKVCKRWYSLQAFKMLQRRTFYAPGGYPCIVSKKGDRSGGYPCTVSKKGDRSGRESHFHSLNKVLKFKKVDSEWRLAVDLLKACKRHTHSLEIEDCTNISERGYQLISAFASNLKSIRLASCNSADDPSLDAILSRSSSLRSMHVYMAPKWSLRNVESNASRLQELVVRGCSTVTPRTLISILKGCPNLRSLRLTGMGVGHYMDEENLLISNPVRLQTLELSNTFGVTDGFLLGISTSLCNLSKLDLTHCSLVSDDGLKAVIALCGSGLQKLVLSRCPRVSDGSVRALAGEAVNLRDVSFAGTNVGDDAIVTLMEAEGISCKLRNLCLAGCARVTDAVIRHVVSKNRQLQSLKTVDVQSCPEVIVTWPKILRAGEDRHVLKLLS